MPLLPHTFLFIPSAPFFPRQLTRQTPLPPDRSNIPRSKKEGFDPPSSLSHERHPSAGLADLRQPTQAAGELGNGQSISQGLLDQFERSSQQERVLQGWDLTGPCIFSFVLKGWEGREGWRSLGRGLGPGFSRSARVDGLLLLPALLLYCVLLAGKPQADILHSLSSWLSKQPQTTPPPPRTSPPSPTNTPLKRNTPSPTPLPSPPFRRHSPLPPLARLRSTTPSPPLSAASRLGEQGLLIWAG